MYSRMWQTPNLCSAYKHPALMQLQANNNEFHSWFHSRKPSMDDVGNPTSVNARWVRFIMLSNFLFFFLASARNTLVSCRCCFQIAILTSWFTILSRQFVSTSISLSNIVDLKYSRSVICLSYVGNVVVFSVCNNICMKQQRHFLKNVQ